MRIWDSLRAKINPDYPAPHKPADADDDLGWERALHGTFEEHAAPDGAVKTFLYEGDD